MIMVGKIHKTGYLTEITTLLLKGEVQSNEELINYLF